MITDNGLRLATAEVTPNGGAAPGGLTAASVALNTDPSGLTSSQRIFNSIGDGERMLLNFNVITAYACGTFAATIEFQLISLPIIASLLTNATTSGKRTHIAALPTVAATNQFTLVGHGLPLGTPIYFSTVTTTTGIVTNVIYYVIPNGADSFQVATTLANALAGTAVVLTNNGSVTMEFVATIHASSGSLQLFDNPTDASSLRAGVQFQVPLRPLAALTPKQRLPTGQTLKQPTGAGPQLGLLAANAQRYYYLRVIPSATITAGAITCDLVHSADDPLNYSPSGFEVIG